MPEIQINQEIIATNLISARQLGGSIEIQATSQRLAAFMKENGLAKTAPIMSVTYSIDQSSGKMDMEILIPLDREFEPPDGCVKKPEFKLTNAVKIRHEGNPATLQKSCDELMKYIADNKWTPITAAYIVTVKEPQSIAELDSAIMDVYIGINPNVL